MDKELLLQELKNGEISRDSVARRLYYLRNKEVVTEHDYAKMAMFNDILERHYVWCKQQGIPK